MFDKLELLIEKFEELEKKIKDPEIMKDMNVWQKLAKEHGDMKPIVEKYREYSKHKKELEENILKETKKLEELQKNAGSEDYRNAQGIMRPTFVKVVNDDVTELLPLIKCPVLLVWGDLDTAAPLWMGQQMEKMMPDAGLAIFAGDDHWAYWHQADRFNRVLDIFLKETA